MTFGEARLPRLRVGVYSLGAGLIAAALAVAAQGLAGDEEAAHYLLARFAPGQPELFLSLVGRPFVTLVLAGPAQFGFVAARLVTVMASLITAYLLVRLAWRARLSPFVAAAALVLQPFYLAHAGAVMTEAWTALFIAHWLLAVTERRAWVLAGSAALLPLVRPELAVLWPLAGAGLYSMGAFRRVWVLPLPLLVWHATGAITHGDPLWLLNQASLIPYPQRSAWHYLGALGWVLGAGLAVPVVVGAWGAIRTRTEGRPLRAQTLHTSLALVLCFIALYTALAWLRPVTGGNLRYLAGAAPALAILAAEGIERLAGPRSRGTTLSGLLGALLAATVWARVFHSDFASLGPIDLFLVTAAALWLLVVVSPLRLRWVAVTLMVVLGATGMWRNHRDTLHLHPTGEVNAVADAGDFVADLEATRYVAQHPLLALRMDHNPYDPSIWLAPSPEVLASPRPGDVLFWDSHYFAMAGPQARLGALVADGDWQFLGGAVSPDGNFACGWFQAGGDSVRIPTQNWFRSAIRAENGVPRSQTLVERDPDNAALRRSLVMRLLVSGDLDEAARELELVRQLDSGHPETLALEVRLLEQLEQYDAARRRVESSLRLHPDDGELLLQAGRLRLRDGDAPGGKEALLAAADRLPHRWEAQRMAASILCIDGDWERAEPYLRAALALQPDDETSRERLRECLLQLGREAEAGELGVPGGGDGGGAGDAGP